MTYIVKHLSAIIKNSIIIIGILVALYLIKTGFTKNFQANFKSTNQFQVAKNNLADELDSHSFPFNQFN